MGGDAFLLRDNSSLQEVELTLQRLNSDPMKYNEMRPASIILSMTARIGCLFDTWGSAETEAVRSEPTLTVPYLALPCSSATTHRRVHTDAYITSPQLFPCMVRCRLNSAVLPFFLFRFAQTLSLSPLINELSRSGFSF